MPPLTLDAATAAMLIFAALPAASGFAADAGTPSLELKQGDHNCCISNTLGERRQFYHHVETLLLSRYPELKLTVRIKAYSADSHHSVSVFTWAPKAHCISTKERSIIRRSKPLGAQLA